MKVQPCIFIIVLALINPACAEPKKATKEENAWQYILDLESRYKAARPDYCLQLNSACLQYLLRYTDDPRTPQVAMIFMETEHFVGAPPFSNNLPAFDEKIAKIVIDHPASTPEQIDAAKKFAKSADVEPAQPTIEIPVPTPAPTDDKTNEPIGYWSVVYDKVDPRDWSPGSQKAFEEKQRYDYMLYKAGRVFSAGIFKPHGEPNQWVLLLQPMKKTEALEIMQNDPTVKGGYTKAEVKMFVTYLPPVGQVTEQKDPNK